SFASSAKLSGRGGLEDTPKGRTLHVTRGAARSGVPQAVAHRGQLADRSVQLLGLRRELPPIDTGPSVRSEHEPDVLQREAGRAPERNQREPLQHSGIELTAQSPPADR